MKKIVISILILFLFISVTYSQVGNLDETFNSSDLGYGFGDGSYTRIDCSATQNDGKIILGGIIAQYNSNVRSKIVRVNTDGSIDLTFNIGSGFQLTGSSTIILLYSITIQSDGKILVGGEFSHYNGTPVSGIARLNSDGTLDTSFNPGTGIGTGNIRDIILQSDGKIIIGGTFNSYNGTSINRVARLNPNGSLDNTFNIGSGANSYINSVALQGDGKILVGGNFSSFNGTNIRGIARLNPNGSLDASFNTGSGSGLVLSCNIQNDGKIIIGGDFTNFNGISINRVARLNSDGSLDATFNVGSGANAALNKTCIQNDGKIIIGGGFTSFNGILKNYLVRLNLDGSIDNSFNTLITTGNGMGVTALTIQNNGKIIVGGDFNEINGRLNWFITRLNTDGSLDDFNQGTGVAGYMYGSTIETTNIQSDGKIIIGGVFYTYNGKVRNSLSRINTDGSIDTTFNPGTGVGISRVINCSAIQSDGKIIIGGNFTSYNGISRNKIARINSNGTLDASFNTSGTFPDGEIFSIAIQTDGKIIIGGDFIYTYILNNNPVQCKNIARLNSNGTIDASFIPGTGANNKVKTISIQQDGKIIIGGDFITYNGVSKNYVARLNTSGGLDVLSGTGTNGSIEDIKIQSDGKIILVGSFTSYNSTSINKIVRLNLDGTIDAAFNIGTGADNTIFSTSIQSDGKIVIGGLFTTVNGSQKNKIARLLSNGALDLNFDSGLGPQSFSSGTNAIGKIYSTQIQNDGKIIIGGNFAAYNGIGRNRITRIYGGEPCVISTNSIVGSSFCAGASFNVSYSITGNVYSGNVFTAQLSDASGSFISPINIGSTTSTSNGTILVTIPNNQVFGTSYRIRVISSQPTFNGSNNGNNITINPVPAPPGNISGNTIICNGSANSYSINSISGASSYTWVLPNGWTGTSSSTTINTTSGSTGGNIEVSANNSCGSSLSQSLSITVITLPPSTPGLINGDNSICNESSNNYSILDVTDATSYSWTLPSGWNGSSTTTSINTTSGSTGGNIEVTAINSCGSSPSQVFSVTVNPSTTSQLTQTAVGSYTLNGQTYTQSGTYTQVLQNSFGCDSTITLNLTINTSGLSEINNNQISIAPNPTTNLTTLTVSQEFIGKSFSITDFAGRIVLQGKIQSLNQTIDLQKVARGSYFLTIENTNLPGFKIIKE